MSLSNPDDYITRNLLISTGYLSGVINCEIEYATMSWDRVCDMGDQEYLGNSSGETSGKTPS
jgi:hypothetical protein